MSLVDRLRAYLNEEEPEDNMSAEAVAAAKQEKKKNKKEKNEAKKIEKSEKRQQKAAAKHDRAVQMYDESGEDVQNAYKSETVENTGAASNMENITVSEAAGVVRSAQTVGNMAAEAEETDSTSTSRKKKKLGLFGRKKRRQQEIDEENVADEINTGRQVSTDYETVKDFCEQLIDVSYHMEDMKREYRIVTEYLTDIQRIEELPINIVNDITDVARKIDMLDNNMQI